MGTSHAVASLLTQRPYVSSMTTARFDSASPGPGQITFNAFQKLIHDRFHKTDSARGAVATFLWLMEEVGELATAIQENSPSSIPGTPTRTPTPEQRANLEEEFADVLAWLTTIANVMNVDLEKALEKYTVRGVKGEKH